MTIEIEHDTSGLPMDSQEISNIIDGDIVLQNAISRGVCVPRTVEEVEEMQRTIEKEYGSNLIGKVTSFRLRNGDGSYIYRALQLVFLRKNMPMGDNPGHMISIREITRFVQALCPLAQDTQQVRHLNEQHGWWVLTRGSIIPEGISAIGPDGELLTSGDVTPSGYHMLVTTLACSPAFKKDKRKGSVADTNWDQMLHDSGGKCLTCGEKCSRLQKGHLFSNRQVSETNIRPTCPSCNMYHKNDWGMTENKGRVRVHCMLNPMMIDKSPDGTQIEVLRRLIKRFPAETKSLMKNI